MTTSIRNRWLRVAPGVALLTLLAAGCKKGDDSGTSPTPTPPTNPTMPSGSSQVAMWLTLPDQSVLFKRQAASLQFTTTPNSDPTIAVDTTQTYQTMDGFGYTLTGGSAQLMSRMSATSRAALIKELFATDSTSLGVSYLRVSIGASDLSDHVYTYDDSAQPDPDLTNFSLVPDQTYLIPVLKEILAVNPAIKILGSPWTAPIWMKNGPNFNTSPSSIGGSLKPEYYDAYARYFVKYIQGMKAQGITIDAVTLQNEPLNPNNNPSLYMTGAEQATFIKNNVGPAFRAAGLSTKIIAYDHNPDTDGINFVNAVLSDAGASPFVDGTGFHLYNGTSINTLSNVRNQYPAKNIYFTEQWTQANKSFSGDLFWHVSNLEIGAPANWSRNVLEWNLASDPATSIHTPGGCSDCLGAITINGDQVTRNVAYYSIAHSSKFVRPGSVRVATTSSLGSLLNVAYKTPSGKRVLVVVNGGGAQKFNIKYKGKLASTTLNSGAVATYIW
jgi:glucosylceramidase